MIRDPLLILYFSFQYSSNHTVWDLLQHHIHVPLSMNEEFCNCGAVHFIAVSSKISLRTSSQTSVPPKRKISWIYFPVNMLLNFHFVIRNVVPNYGFTIVPFLAYRVISLTIFGSKISPQRVGFDVKAHHCWYWNVVHISIRCLIPIPPSS